MNSALAYYYSFFENYNYISLFKYLDITDDEKNTLIKEFGLQQDKKYGQEIWRMGDGQSSFNNLLYSVLCDSQKLMINSHSQLEKRNYQKGCF